MYWWLIAHIEGVGAFAPLSLTELDEICDKHDAASIERSTMTEFSIKHLNCSMAEFRAMQAEHQAA